MNVDRHTLAIVSITGSGLDVIGTLYLAYDLLGGEHGPLRILTRGVTYSLLFGAGFGLAMGPVFGIVVGAAHGVTLAWELARASRHEPEPAFWQDAATSAVRGGAYAIGASYLFGPLFGAVFGFLSFAGQLAAYRGGIRPTLDYQPSTRPRLTRKQFWAAVNRMIGYAVAGYLSSIVSGQRTNALALGIRSGLSIGAVTAISNLCMPFVEWLADHVPERSMGVFGIVLILAGFMLQSVQYWTVVLDVNVR